MLPAPVVQYDRIAITLHWLMAALVIGLFFLGIYMVQLDYYDPWYHDAPDLHKAIAIIFLGLLCGRLGWRLLRSYPAPFGRPWERGLARFVHGSHYLLMIIIGISGYLLPTAKGAGVDVFGFFTVPSLLSLSSRQSDLAGLVHRQASWVLMALVALHVLAAFKHHLIDRDPTLLRMIGKGDRK